MAEQYLGPYSPSFYNPTTLNTGTWSAAPSGTLSGTYAQGASAGVAPGEHYSSGANLTGMYNNVPGTYQTQSGPVVVGSTLGSSTGPVSTPPPSNVPLTGKYTGWGQAEANADAAAGGNVGAGPSNDQLMQEINNAYNSSYDYFNQAEGNLRSQLPETINSIEGNYGVNKQLLETQNQQAMGQLAGQTNQANLSKEQQQAQIRRLYQELQMGYRQRFGGSTSAGQAASEIANVEQQRQTGQLAQKYADTIRQINGQQSTIQQNYTDSLLKLQQQKQDATMQANQDFQNNMLKITQARAQTDQDKAQARLSALMDYRNKIFSIEQQNLQFKQTLEAQRQAAQLQLQQYAQTQSSGLSTATGAFNNYQSSLKTPSSNLQTNKISTSVAPTYTGAITNAKDDYNQLQGSINPSWNYYDRLTA